MNSPVKKSGHKFNKKANLLIKLLLILILISLIFLVVINLLGYNSNNIIVTNYDTISNQFKSTALIIRDEEVVFAPQAGQIELNVSEGERVSAGNLIATIRRGKKDNELYNYEPGIISYKVDGLENSLEREDISDLSYKKISKLKGSINVVESGESINAGRPLFKVINNFNFYLAVLLPEGELQNYELQDKVEIVFSKFPTQILKGRVYKTILDSPQNIMVLKVDRFLPKLIDLRKVRVKVVKERYHGIVVPEDAIIEENEKTKVRIRGYVKDYTKEVKVKAKIEDKVIIKKGLSPGTKVILN
ncbi:putative membrane fusion protein [Halanaerobacter jeridensis]|uniref:Membrane fusion protein n=1 Tax=Halanaerobacter jeridensis TaxID=706427 RepID=A0A938XUG3_9FIRM|nr:HlyD family efflux transporter periplasmic adaptor subunit [Halanaerobacter jeridensis]MBM7555465.1 putative membrane fusion protein [Halanaerobacter jeridensis]